MADKDCDQDFCKNLKKFFDSRGGSVKVRELKKWLVENCKGDKNEGEVRKLLPRMEQRADQDIMLEEFKKYWEEKESKGYA